MKNESCEKQTAGIEGLLRGARPEPDEEFSNIVRSTLAALPEGGSRKVSIPRPLIIVAAVLLTLVLGMGVAYASGAFQSIFGSAKTNVEDRIDQYNAEYDDKREEMQHMDENDAAELDNELDDRSEKNNYDLVSMIGAEQHAVEIRQEDGGITLSEFSAVTYDGYKPTYDWRIYLSFTAPEGYEYPYGIGLIIDGMELSGYRTDLPAEATEENPNPMIYACMVYLDRTALPEISLVTAKLDDRRFCFVFNWEEESYVLPQNESHKAELLNMNSRLTESYSALKVGVLTGTVVDRDVRARIADARIEGNRLILSLSISVPEELMGIDLNILDTELIIGETVWDWSTLFFDHSAANTKLDFMADNPETPTVTLTLPLAPSVLFEGELTFRLTLFEFGLSPTAEQERFYEFGLEVK